MVGVSHVEEMRCYYSFSKKKIAQTTHKYGIEIPTSWNYAVKIDTKNGNQLWRDALAKEMKYVGVAFDVLKDHQSVPVG